MKTVVHTSYHRQDVLRHRRETLATKKNYYSNYKNSRYIYVLICEYCV